MRIALVVTGGVDRSGRFRVIPTLLSLIERLASRHDLVVYALRYHDAPCSYSLLGAMVHDLGRPHGPIEQHCALRSALDRDGPFDVVHGYWGMPAGLAATTAARRLRIPSIVTLDSGELVSIRDIRYGLQGTIRQRVAVATAIRLATRVTVCSEYMQRMAAHRGVVADRIAIGVDRDRFPVSDAADGPPWRIVHVASVNAVKDQTTLVEAFAILTEHFPIHLDIVGEDTLAGATERLAARLRVSDAVTFHGFQPSDVVAAFFRRAHVHVLSSRHEAAGAVTLEAAVAGVPTVGTAVGYVSDWAPDRAVAVPTRAPGALAAAIGDLLEDPDRRRRIAATARRWALAHDADWTARRFEALYQEVTAS